MPIKDRDKRRAYHRRYMRGYLPEYRRQERQFAKMGAAVMKGNKELLEQLRKDMANMQKVRFGTRLKREKK